MVGCDARQGHCGPVVARVGVGEVRLGTCCRVLHLLHPLVREVCCARWRRRKFFPRKRMGEWG